MVIRRRTTSSSSSSSSSSQSSYAASANYQSAIEALNNLQSNATYLKNATRYTNTLKDTEKYLIRSGLTVDDLKKLSIIHVAGTKGKGSTCAFTESILLHHEYKTGLYTSPHLVSVRERIRINGQSITEELFAKEFWRLHNCLSNKKDNDSDMPPYFRFLTILMFHIFLKASIDVAIIEVGIGGLNDCTNIIPTAVCVGITRLDLDHTALLGDTLSAIAVQKAGIFKKNVPAFSVTQLNKEVTTVLTSKANIISCPLNFVTNNNNNNNRTLGISSTDFQQSNASLAIELSRTYCLLTTTTKRQFDLDKVEIALKNCKWPGRTQIYNTKYLDFYLDGAHTVESIKCCVDWFKKSRLHGEKSILIFNTTGNRDTKSLLDILQVECNFSKAIFVPNFSGIVTTTTTTTNNEQDNRILPFNEQIKKCKINCEYWGSRSRQGDGNGNASSSSSSFSSCSNSVKDALELIKFEFNKNKEEGQQSRAQVLVTGSLHLVGATLTLLDPQLTMKSSWF